jgi:hypothetical protein
MGKKVFFSELFGRNIQAEDNDYWIFVYAETLFRYYRLVEADCSCYECKQKVKKLEEYLKTDIRYRENKNLKLLEL